MKGYIRRKFEKAFSAEEDRDTFLLKNAISETFEGMKDGRCLLFERIAQELGMTLSPQTLAVFTDNPSIFEYHLPLDETDLTSLDVRVKQMNIALHSQV